MANNEQNLIPLNRRSKEAAKVIQTAGGLARGQQQRERKHGKELARLILAEGLKDEKVKTALRKAGHDTADMDNETAMLLRQIEKALKTGDTKAYKAVMDVAGYLEKTVNVKTPDPLVITEEEAAKLDKWAKDE